VAKLSPKIFSSLLCCSCMSHLVNTAFSVVILQDLHNLVFFLLLQYTGVFSKCKGSTVMLTYITNLLDVLGDSARRNHDRFLLKYILPWLLGFLQKY